MPRARAIGLGVSGVLVCALLAAFASGCTRHRSDGGEVIVYTSVDQVYAEPVLLAFEKDTGVKVRAVYDAEAAKTTGLVNRLIAEKTRPRADVWWSGEIVQTLKLAEGGVLAPYVSPAADAVPDNLRDPKGLWTGFGGRARVLLVSPAFKGTTPTSIRDLTTPPDTAYAKPRIAMASPVFGTASTQAAVLYASWDPETAYDYYDAAVRRGVRVLEGNGDVRDRVVTGELDWGLTDTDDALGAGGKDAGMRIRVTDQGPGGVGAIRVPDTVGLVAGAPNDANGRRLIDYLLSAATEKRMVEAGWIQFPVRGAPDPRVSSSPVRFADIDWAKAYAQLGPSAADMKELFLK